MRTLFVKHAKRAAGSLLSVIASLAFVCSAGDAQSTAAPPTGDLVKGKANFMAYGCYECHGTAGQGNFFSGPKIAPPILPLVALLSYIRKPGGQMPSYSAAILTEKDAADIWSYLSSVPATKSVNQIPILAGVKSQPSK